MWICPECKMIYDSFGSGICPCSDYRGRTVEIKEVNLNTIRFSGNKERFAGQKRGVLLSAELQLVKEMSSDLVKYLGGDLPRGSAILCVYLGEKGIPFAELRNYGSASLIRLKNSIGQWFTVDCAPDAETVRLNFGGDT